MNKKINVEELSREIFKIRSQYLKDDFESGVNEINKNRDQYNSSSYNAQITSVIQSTMFVQLTSYTNDLIQKVVDELNSEESD